MHNGRFTTKNEALQMAKHVWTCRYCRSQHVKGANTVRAGHFKITEKPKYCHKCDQSSFYHFPSLGEANRFAELALMQDCGKISDLLLQVPFPIKVRGQKIFEYRADFKYKTDDGTEIVEDYKGAKAGYETDLFKLKKKLVEAAYQINISITR